MLEDLTTAYAGYVDGLRDEADETDMDSPTLIAGDLPNTRAMGLTRSDLNTLYGLYCGLLSKVPHTSYSIFHNPAANPAVTTLVDYFQDTPAYNTAAARVRQAGADHLFELMEWNLIEPTVGVYSTGGIDRIVAASGDLPLWINIAPIGTDGQRHVPTELASTDWDDPAMIAAYTNMLTHIAPRLDGRLVILTVGNESDQYLDAHTGEIAAYATFFGAVRTHARTLFGTRPFLVTVGFQFVALVEWAQYEAIHDLTDVESFTYYFLTGNSFETDLLNLAAIIGLDNQYVFQEIGYTSHSLFSSTEAIQDTVASVAFPLLNLWGAQGMCRGAVWHQLSDYQTNVLDDAFSTPLLEFFSEMGLRDLDNAPKTAWPTVVGFLGGTTGD